VNQLFKIDFDKRIFGLDILRFFAIFFVMNRHANDLILPYTNKDVLKVFELDGVTIFYVLSGFLIGRILLKIYFKDDQLRWSDLKNFWARRWIRTIPPYFLVLTTLILIQLINGNPFEIFYLKYYAFIQNLWYPHPMFFGEAHSLSVEEWFYLSFPFVLFLLATGFKQRSKPAFLFITGIFIVLSLAFRSYITLKADQLDFPVTSIYKYYIQKVVLTRFDSLMFGVLAAYVFRFHSHLWQKHKEVCFFLGLIFLFSYKLFPWGQFANLKGIWGLTHISLGVALLLPKLNTLKIAESIFAKFIVIISVSSYAMYLINLTLRQVLIDYLPAGTATSAYFKYFLFWIFTIIASIIFYRFIEYPVLAIRDRLFKKQTI